MNLPRMLAYVPTPRLAAGLAVAVLTLTACGGGGSSSTASDIAVTPNRQPTIDSLEPIEVLEGSQVSVEIKSTDPDGDPLSWSLSGVDAAFFTIDSDQIIRFTALPDWERREDSNADNVFELTVAVSDGSQSVSTPLAISLINALEGSVVDGPIANARVFIDQDGNGAFTAGETDTQSDENGNFFYAVSKRSGRSPDNSTGWD